MNRIAAYTDFYDASVLLRIYTEEPGSSVVREYIHRRPTGYTTPFCFYEALNGLKGKWKYKGQLTKAQYLEASFQLTAWYGATSEKIADLDFSDPLVFKATRDLASRHELDLSDAFQIMSVKHGFFSPLVGDSTTLFITCDTPLFFAAKAEGLRSWNPLVTAAP